MGLDRSLYLGPYVECTYKPGKRVDKVWGCTLKECKKHPKKAPAPAAEGKFCSTCGSANGHIPIEVEARIYYQDVLGRENEDALFDLNGEGGERDVLYLAPNEARKGDPRKFDPDEETFHYDLRIVSMR